MKKTLMQLNAYSNKKILEKEIQKKGKGVPYIYQNRAYLEKKTKGA